MNCLLLQKALGITFVLTIVAYMPGCSSTSKSKKFEKDAKLERFVTAGRESYDEGDFDAAKKKYRSALIRAWAMDDPYESGSAAYHLAACLSHQGNFCLASEWLVDARVELCRARSSTGNTWLLSAEIAMAENRFQEAECFIEYAARSGYPNDCDEPYRLCGPDARMSERECKENCWAKLPIWGKRYQKRKATEACKVAYEARIHLARARLAAKQFDACQARDHYECAVGLDNFECNLELMADIHDVAAIIYDLEGNPLQAGAHRDKQVEVLRCISLYREIPSILDSAAESYCMANRFDLTIDRLVRSARIYLARGEFDKAWVRIRRASEIAGDSCCEAHEIRLSLTASILEDIISRKQPLTDFQSKDGREDDSGSTLEMTPSNGEKS